MTSRKSLYEYAWLAYCIQVKEIDLILNSQRETLDAAPYSIISCLLSVVFVSLIIFGWLANPKLAHLFLLKLMMVNA